MDRYWPSTIASARARGVERRFPDLERAVPRPDINVLLTLDESERQARLQGRGLVTDADRETLDPQFRACVMAELRRLTTLEVDVTGAPPAAAVERVLAAVQSSLPPSTSSTRFVPNSVPSANLPTLSPLALAPAGGPAERAGGGG